MAQITDLYRNRFICNLKSLQSTYSLPSITQLADFLMSLAPSLLMSNRWPDCLQHIARLGIT